MIPISSQFAFISLFDDYTRLNKTVHTPDRVYGPLHSTGNSWVSACIQIVLGEESEGRQHTIMVCRKTAPGLDDKAEGTAAEALAQELMASIGMP